MYEFKYILPNFRYSDIGANGYQFMSYCSFPLKKYEFTWRKSCVNEHNTFCFTCDKFCRQKQRQEITKFMKQMQQAYSGMNLAQKNKYWATFLNEFWNIYAHLFCCQYPSLYTIAKRKDACISGSSELFFSHRNVLQENMKRLPDYPVVLWDEFFNLIWDFFLQNHDGPGIFSTRFSKLLCLLPKSFQVKQLYSSAMMHLFIYYLRQQKDVRYWWVTNTHKLHERLLHSDRSFIGSYFFEDDNGTHIATTCRR